jgi:hypothetical protein
MQRRHGGKEQVRTARGDKERGVRGLRLLQDGQKLGLMLFERFAL